MTSYPTTDRMVFAERFNGIIFERGGVVIIGNDSSIENGEQQVLYTDVLGNIMGYDDIKEIWSVMERYSYIGKVGDVIVPYKLSQAIAGNLKSNFDDFEAVLVNAEEFFKIDWDKAEDTIKMRIDNTVGEKYDFRIDVDSEFYSFGDLLFFNLENKDYQCEDRNYGFEQAIIVPLATYCRILNKPIGLDIDFANWVNERSEEEDVIENNNIINEYRQKYLGQIRDYIAQGVKRELERECFPIGRWKKYETVNLDGVVIPLN